MGRALRLPGSAMPIRGQWDLQQRGPEDFGDLAAPCAAELLWRSCEQWAFSHRGGTRAPGTPIAIALRDALSPTMFSSPSGRAVARGGSPQGVGVCCIRGRGIALIAPSSGGAVDAFSLGRRADAVTLDVLQSHARAITPQRAVIVISAPHSLVVHLPSYARFHARWLLVRVYGGGRSAKGLRPLHAVPIDDRLVWPSRSGHIDG